MSLMRYRIIAGLPLAMPLSLAVANIAFLLTATFFGYATFISFRTDEPPMFQDCRQSPTKRTDTAGRIGDCQILLYLFRLEYDSRKTLSQIP